MITVLLHDPATNKARVADREAIDSWSRDGDELIWVDIENEAEDVEVALMEKTFGLHPLAVHDATRERHPPKVEQFEDSTFILLRGLDSKSTDLNFGVIQLAVFYGRNFIVTRHVKPSLSVNWLRAQLLDGGMSMALGADMLVVRLINRLVRRYLQILFGLEPRLEEIESAIFAHPDDTLMSELTRYKSGLRQIMRIARYHLTVVTNLRTYMNEDIEVRHELTDVYEQLERTVSLADLHYVMATDLVDGHLAYSSHRLNRVMQILTVFTVIFVPLTFIAGIYGMNFEHMPELHSQNGYFIVLGGMSIIGLALLVFFRRKHWV